MEIWESKKSPIWSSPCSASVISGDDEEYGLNNECRATEVIGQALLQRCASKTTHRRIGIGHHFACVSSLIKQKMPPRRIKVGHAPETPPVIHSYAQYEKGAGRQPRVGWVWFRVGNQPPLGQTLVVEQCITETWKLALGRCTDISFSEA